MQNIDNLKNKNIAFFGTPTFIVEFLELFKNLGINIRLIVTGEDKPVGRGMQMQKPAPAKWAEASIEVVQPKKLDEDFYNFLKQKHEEENFDLFIVIAYGKIIPEKIINLPKFGTINLHYSLLPKYRGASPVESAILNGETESGITIQQMVYKLDAGDILFQEKMNIEENDTTGMLRAKMNKRAIEIFPEFLEFMFSDKTNPPTQSFDVTKQDEKEATVCGKFKKEDLDVTEDIQNQDLETIFKKYKAFDRKIFFFFAPLARQGERIRVKITEMCKTPGGLQIIKVLPESKKEISKSDFENSFGKIF